MNRAAVSRWIFCALFWVCVCVVGMWMADDDPPFRLISYEPVTAKRGQFAAIRAKVHRDLERNCSVKFARYLFDAKGYRYDLPPAQEMTTAGIRMLGMVHPGELRITIPIPADMTPGTARFVTDLSYVCTPFHVLQPIPVLMEVRIEVLP